MRKSSILTSGWKFSRGDIPDMHMPHFNDSAWVDVRVPHDWAITGPFDKNNDMQYTKIIANGETKESFHTGRTGGLPHVGTACYRLHIQTPLNATDNEYQLEFDGIMSQSSIFINGVHVGGRPYGYSSFYVDISKFMNSPGEDNVLAIRVDNPSCSSRWYPGAGIYREVRFVEYSGEHFPYQGVHLRTEQFDINNRSAILVVEAERAKPLSIHTIIRDQYGNKIANGGDRIFLENLNFWSPECPTLYSVEIYLFRSSLSQYTDRVIIPYGFRTLKFSPNTGMTLNDQPYRFNGVCLHHDFGALGTAFCASAAKYRLQLLKDIGVNAIRMSHNPQDPQLLSICDEMGFLVIAEAFDMWAMPKISGDYHRHFANWHELDLGDMIKRDRNHPCIVMWSIGNEVLEQREEEGWKVAAHLRDIVRKIDKSRPVTIGLDAVQSGGEITSNDLANVVDIAGWNYKPHLYRELHQRYPDLPQYGSETASTVSSRGVYKIPVISGPQLYTDNQCSSYDLEHPGWGSTPDMEFAQQDACPWILGEFVWTGFDYLGEPTPYGGENDWPSRSSYFGIFDLAGIAKDRAWLYKSRWTKEPVLHLLPHWNWSVGEIIPVHVYTNLPCVELFINGRSLGTQSGGLRRIWEQVIYEPGELLAIGYNNDGIELMRDFRKTARDATGLIITTNCDTLIADNDDTVFVNVVIVDSENTPVPYSSERIFFAVENGTLAAIDNGNAHSLEGFRQSSIPAFSGKCAAMIRASIPGKVKIEVTMKNTVKHVLLDALENSDNTDRRNNGFDRKCGRY